MGRRSEPPCKSPSEIGSPKKSRKPQGVNVNTRKELSQLADGRALLALTYTYTRDYLGRTSSAHFLASALSVDGNLTITLTCMAP